MIIHNRARCHLCGQTIESTHRHDRRTCSCGNLSVDGGTEYLRRGFLKGQDTWTDESIETKVDNGVPHRWYPILIAGIREMLEVDPTIKNIEIVGICNISYEGGNLMCRDIVGNIADKMFADCTEIHSPANQNTLLAIQNHSFDDNTDDILS